MKQWQQEKRRFFVVPLERTFDQLEPHELPAELPGKIYPAPEDERLAHAYADE